MAKKMKSKSKVSKKVKKPAPKRRLLKARNPKVRKAVRRTAKKAVKAKPRSAPKKVVTAKPAKPQEIQFTGVPMRVEMARPAEVIEWPRSLVHHHTYGLLSPFFQGLLKGELRATRCVNPKCDEKRLWLPPRADCPDCHARMEWVKLPNPVIATVFTFTHVEYPGHGIELSYPYYQIDVVVPGAATVMKGYLIRGEARIGMKVKAGFRTKNPTNTILDLYWEPVD
jgi:uncharacterized OB-fold protein